MKLRVAGVILTVLTLAGPGYLQDTKFAALFVFNFARYVEWPSEAQSGNFEFVVLGRDPIYDELSTIAGKTTLDTRVIAVRQVERLDDIGVCHILYISPGRSDELGAALAKIGSAHTLVVTNKSGAGARGAAINLVMLDGKQRYEINPEGLKKGGLTAKPVLFKLGKVLEQ